jgi:hypothetical protein
MANEFELTKDPIEVPAPMKKDYVWIYAQGDVTGAVPFQARNKEEVQAHIENLVQEAEQDEKDTIIFLGRLVSLEHAFFIKDAVLPLSVWVRTFNKDLFKPV